MHASRTACSSNRASAGQTRPGLGSRPPADAADSDASSSTCAGPPWPTDAVTGTSRRSLNSAATVGDVVRSCIVELGVVDADRHRRRHRIGPDHRCLPRSDQFDVGGSTVDVRCGPVERVRRAVGPVETDDPRATIDRGRRGPNSLRRPSSPSVHLSPLERPPAPSSETHPRPLRLIEPSEVRDEAGPKVTRGPSPRRIQRSGDDDRHGPWPLVGSRTRRHDGSTLDRALRRRHDR